MPKRSTPRALTAKEQAFCWAYVGKARGNATEAATMAGMGSPETSGARALKRSVVQSWLEAWRTRREGQVIASADTRDRVLSEILLDDEADRFSRIQAAKELNKVTGRHSINHIITGTLTLEDAIAASRRPAPELPAAPQPALPAPSEPTQ